MPGFNFSDFSKPISRLTKTSTALASPKLTDTLKRHLLSQLPEADRPLLERKLKAFNIDLDQVKDKSLSTLVTETLLPKLSRDQRVKTMLTNLAGSLKTDARPVAGLVGLDLPLKENPIFRDDYLAAKRSAYGKIISLSTAALKKLGAEAADIDDLDEAAIDRLAANRTLSVGQQSGLRLLIDLSRLSGENLDLIRTLHNSSVTIESFIGYEAEDWKALLKGKNIPLPAGEKSADTYAASLAKGMELSFPAAFFLQRINRKNFGPQLKSLDVISWAESHGGMTIKDGRVSFDNLQWTGVSETKKKALRQDMDALASFVNTYRPLGLAGLLTGESSMTDKKKAVSARLAQLALFYKNNEALDLTTFDFFDPQRKPDYSGIDEANKPLVKAQALALQRMLHLGETTKTTLQLLAKGYASSRDIIAAGERDFVASAGLELNEAKKIYTAAQDTGAATANFLQAVRDAQRGGFRSIAKNNMQPLAGELRGIKGYEALFGSQNYCDCAHCRSVFSPAAYFADLMLFVDKHITRRIPEEAAQLRLGNRRADLWKLPLSCRNTNTEIPYLDVVIGVLEQYTKASLQDPDVYKTLAEAGNSMGLPFNLPLAGLRLYLSHFGLPLSEVYALLGESGAAVAQERLLLSDEEITLITTPDDDAARAVFGNPADPGDLSVADLIRFAGISRAELEALLQLRSFPEISAIHTVVLQEDGDLQGFEERFAPHSLTLPRLDLLHRFLRLWKKTPWSIPEFDFLLVALQQRGQFLKPEARDPDGRPQLLMLADAIRLQDLLGLNVEELSAILHALPDRPLLPGGQSLYTRLFKLDDILGEAGLPMQGGLPPDSAMPQLLAGLGLSQRELLALLELLAPNEALLSLLNKEVVSRLYRQARIAAGLKLSTDSYRSALRLFNDGREAEVPEEIIRLYESKKRLADSPLGFQQLDFILNGAETAEAFYHYSPEKTEALIAGIRAAGGKAEALGDKVSELFRIPLPFLSGNRRLTLADGAAVIPADGTIAEEKFRALFRELERKALLFARLDWKEEDLSFLLNHPEVFGMREKVEREPESAGAADWTLEDISRMMAYSRLLAGRAPAAREELRALLALQPEADNLGDAALHVLAADWAVPAPLLRSVTGLVSGNLLSSLDRLRRLLAVCDKLGIQGDALLRLRKGDYEVLTESAAIAYGAFAARYPDEKTRLEKEAPYHDSLNVLKRDALCDYLIAQHGRFPFRDRAGLYHFFLLDVEMSGCFRSSRVLAAISSLQLYVQRCLLNLEQPAGGRVIAFSIPVEEWEWRKNYRVWEANRKVFLYPENYIDPALRNTKTPLFRELEDELLQQAVTPDSAEAAYKKYLAGFMELAHLRYAGAYYHFVNNGPVAQVDHVVEGPRDGVFRMRMVLDGSQLFTNIFPDKDKTVFYLFARTHLDPYRYYYRIYNPQRALWGHWEKIELPIEAAEVSAIIHNGKLRLYWTEAQHNQITNFTGGTSSSESVVFKVSVKYAVLDLSNRWSSPQRLSLGKVTTENDRLLARLGFTGDQITEQKAGMDSAIERYKAEVFRKPYVAAAGARSGHKLIIRHLYLPEKNVDRIQYATEAYKGIFWLNQLIGISFEIPSQTFEVLENRFDVLEERPLPDENGLHLKIVLVSPSTAVATVSYGSWDQRFDIAVATVTGLAQTSYAPVFTQDIYSAQSDPNRRFFKPEAPVPQNLQSELALMSLDAGKFAHYAEDGTSDFTKGNNIVEQLENGKAHLKTGRSPATARLTALSTVLSEELNIALWEKGLSYFLSPAVQERSDSAGQKLDFNGPYGAYYWELFFHIPFLLANHLNARQDFKAAKWWYERIFNPGPEEQPGAAEGADRYWQFREFRQLDSERLRDLLSDEAALAAYRNDPFDPHAIARLRISAYQKAVVMKYIDNLLDWGDYLFSQDTQESLVEADMLYQLAQEVLGSRPERLGSCDTPEEDSLTYERILETRTADSSEFLISLENVYRSRQQRKEAREQPLRTSGYLAALLEDMGAPGATPDTLSGLAALSDIRYSATTTATAPATTGSGTKAAVAKYAATVAANYTPQLNGQKRYKDAAAPDNHSVYDFSRSADPAGSVMESGELAFCVPVNDSLLGYWDRVADRLYKLRNCMNLSGQRRSLELFQPPLDPMLLTRMKTAGLSAADIAALPAEAGKPGNYRFAYMLEKAKQFTQSVQSFGAALLTALEKKDGEELSLLRSVQEQNILQLTAEIKRRQLEEAERQYASMEENVANVRNRLDYYTGLLEEGLTSWETGQQKSRHAAALFRTAEGLLHLRAGLHYLIPQIGSAFAMTYGGQELGHSTNAFSEWSSSMAAFADSVSSSAGLEANFQRRKQEWNFHKKTAEQDLKQSSQQLLAAGLRVKIAERDLDTHEKTVGQAAETHAFLRDKLSGIGLYDYMAVSLHRLYRMSYAMALEMARSAERCYQTELSTKPGLIGNDHWQADRAGLLAGEKLMMQLNQLEQGYLTEYRRCPEITQSFSLALLAPEALIRLRQTGTCSFSIPEIAFDLLYPGQYNRRIRAVRVTLPCIAGPYTNISASLTLVNSTVRTTAGAALIPGQAGAEQPSIVLSSAMSDSGMFEFSFRDERYLPFEYAGAVSEWALRLPSKLRSFNYATIADVVMQLSYTAQEGDREAGERDLLDRLLAYSRTEGLFKAVSLKQEFPAGLARLTVGGSAGFELTGDQLPYFLQGQPLAADSVTVFLKPKKGLAVTPPQTLRVNEAVATGWELVADPAAENPATETDGMKKATARLDSRPLPKRWLIETGGGLSSTVIDDVIIVIRYRVQ